MMVYAKDYVSVTNKDKEHYTEVPEALLYFPEAGDLLKQLYINIAEIKYLQDISSFLQSTALANMQVDNALLLLYPSTAKDAYVLAKVSGNEYCLYNRQVLFARLEILVTAIKNNLLRDSEVSRELFGKINDYLGTYFYGAKK